MFLPFGKSIQKRFLLSVRQFSSEIKKCGFNIPYPGYFSVYITVRVPPLQFSNLKVDMVPKISTLPNGLRIVTQDSYEPVYIIPK